jgi:Domain of unknown function (DUF4383)
MSTRTFALVFGIVFLLAGASGFIPGLLHPVPPDAPPLTVATGYGLVMGLLPVNLLHNLVHLLFGILGIVAFAGLFAPRVYAQFVAVAYGLLVVLGMFPATNTLFGLVPIYGNDVWLHLVLGVVAAYFGFLNTPAKRVETA